MITKHTDIYFTNKYSNRFLTEEEAIQDEKDRDYCEFTAKTINKSKHFPEVEHITLSNLKGSGIDVIDDCCKPILNGGKRRVFYLRDLVKNLQLIIDEFGDNVCTYQQHRGMGHYSDAIVILEDNKK